MKNLWLALTLLLVASSAWSQQMPEFLMQEPGSLGEGWAGFADIGFLSNALLKLTLATILGAAIAYHPKHMQTADTLQEIDAPKTFVMYAVIGAIIGIMVVKYGMVVGFVLFGIGGLIRFRTILGSASLTGRVIFVTLIGLSCGLDLPHVAVLSTAFAFVLIYILDARLTYRIDIRALPADRVDEAAAAYRFLLEQKGCRIVNEKKNPERERVSFLFQTSRNITRHHLEAVINSEMEPALVGSMNWELD